MVGMRLFGAALVRWAGEHLSGLQGFPEEAVSPSLASFQHIENKRQRPSREPRQRSSCSSAQQD